MASPQNSDLTQGPVGPLIRGLAIPAAVGYFFNTLFNVVDTIYAGLLSATALTAIGASFPIFFLVIAAMGGTGQATTALVAAEIGRKDQARAASTLRTALVLAAGIGTILIGVGEALTAPVLGLLNISDRAADLAQDYVRPLLLSAPFFLLNAALSGGLMAQGDTKTYRNALIAGTCANIVLNPILMFGLGLGIAGLAVATLTVQVATAVFLAMRVRQTPIADAFSFSLPLLQGPLARRFFAQMAPASGNLALIGSSIFVYTFFIGAHGDAAVAAYTVGLRIEQLVLLPTVGLNVAAVAMIGQNFGAGDTERIRETVRFAFAYGLAIMGTGAVLILSFRTTLMTLFTDDPEVIAVGVEYLFVAALIEIAYVFNMIGAGTLQGIQQPIYGFVVTVGRSLVAPPLVMLLIDQVFGLGLNALFWGIFAINWVSAVVMVAVVERQLRCRCRLSLNPINDGRLASGAD